MNMINLTIDNTKVSVEEGTTILNAAKQIGINIPTLCYHPDQKVKATCRICVVDITGSRKLTTACSTPVGEGMEVFTSNKKVRDARKTILELILADHPQECFNCVRNGNCELQTLAMEFNLRENPFTSLYKKLPIDRSNPSLVNDPNKCIKCGRCVEACQEIQNVGVINTAFRSEEYKISTAFGKPISNTMCIYCGQCSNVCPVGAIYEKDETNKVWKALDEPELHVVVQTAPAVRVALEDEFNLEHGTIATGKMVAALRRLGFDKVFDTNFAADLTIMEEGTELLDRITNNKTLPMMTSCCPGWVTFIEKTYPELIPNLSTCKSPQQMFGAIAKTYYAQKAGIPADKMFVVSIMPCTAKKYESSRPEMNSSGFRDVDVALTTRELSRMIREANIDFESLIEEEYDSPLGNSTGAAVIFGATGGVMEAALRSVYEIATGKILNNIDFKDVRGLDGIKEAEVDLNGAKVKVAVANGIKNARELVHKINAGESDYAFIEVMACPGGCIGGGGQPFGTTNEIRAARIKSTYKIDNDSPLRKSHNNPDIKTLYKDFLKEPLSSTSHHLLHTKYKAR